MKLKHNAGSKTEREKLAKQLAWAIQNGLVQEDHLRLIQGLNINLPPGSIEKAAKSLGIELKSEPLLIQSPTQQMQALRQLEDFIAIQKLQHSDMPHKDSSFNLLGQMESKSLQGN